MMGGPARKSALMAGRCEAGATRNHRIMDCGFSAPKFRKIGVSQFLRSKVCDGLGLLRSSYFCVPLRSR